MAGYLHPRIIGSILVGVALVAGAFVMRNFGYMPERQTAIVSQSAVPVREAIVVVDTDNNGIEDWRDEFVDNAEILVPAPESTEPYVPPTTLTGRLGENFIESYLLTKTQGTFGRSTDELVSDTVDVLAAETAHKLYSARQLEIMDDWENEDIVNYANTAALAITNNNVVLEQGELFILYDALQTEDPQGIAELQLISAAYAGMRDDMLQTPVPRTFVKEHLDLINTYHALHKDVEAMAITLEDPAFALMRLKRYEDDALGLQYALQNMYRALLPYSSLVTNDDPAVLFAIFSPQFTS